MSFEKVMEVAQRRGFMWPSFEIYGGLKGFYDYGPLGALIKRRIENKIREYYIFREGFYEIEAPTIMPEPVFIASGHVGNFADKMTECTKCGEPYRVDHIIKEKLKRDVDGLTTEQLHALIQDNKIVCPKCKGALGSIWDFNLMLKTEVGPGKNKVVAYARPETAQGIFVPYKRLYEFARRTLPFGVLQIGKSYRNEISPRQGMIRLREFTQAEVEIFLKPDDRKHKRFSEIKDEKLRLYTAEDQIKNEKRREEQLKEGKRAAELVTIDTSFEMSAGEAVEKGIIAHEMLAYYLVLSRKLFEEIGIPFLDMRCRQHLPTEKAHYSRDTWDIEINTSFGWVEVVGHADRTDYDLSSHARVSKTELTAHVDGQKVVPHVLEPSYGVDRLFYCVLEKAYREAGEKKDWVTFEFQKCVAPYEVMVCPLVNADGMPEKAIEVFELLRLENLFVLKDFSGSIGRRYARADEIGIPYALTVDSDTAKDNTVTLRDRDTKKQVRVKVEELSRTVRMLLLGLLEFDKAGTPIIRTETPASNN